MTSKEQTLIEVLNHKALLLILDNCEHLLPEIANLAENILRNATTVQILATSREKLGAAGESIWRIPPLSSPDPKQANNIKKIMQYESMRLFQERAAAVKSGFTITRENADAVAKICGRLDGLPLAIELAAARVRALSVGVILRRLDDRFRLLVGSRTALPRQQTLRALVDWNFTNATETGLLT